MIAMERFVRLLPRGGFARNAVTLMAGTTLAQAIPVGVSPILTRLYSPEDFGHLALYTTVVSLISVAAAGRYELAIMRPRAEEDAAQLVRLSVCVALAVSLVLLGIVALTSGRIAALLGVPGIEPWLYLVPVSVLLVGMYQAFNYWLNRQRQYREMARNRVIQSATTASSNVAMGLAGFGTGGLILGSILGQGLTTALIARGFLSRPRHRTGATMRGVAKTYRAHPTFLMPSHLIGAGNGSIPVFFITAVFGSTPTGYFSLASRLMGLPTSLISTAIGDVLRQRATELYHRQGEFRSLWLKTFWHIAGLGLVPFAIFAALAPAVFEIVFGGPWRVAGEYARILTPQFFFAFVFGAVDKSALIVGANRYIFWWHFSRFCANVVAAGLTFAYDLPIKPYLYLLAAINIAFYSLDIAVSYRLSLGSPTGADLEP